MTFQLGDKVLVKKAMPDHPCWIEDMDDWVGIVGVIRDTHSGETAARDTARVFCEAKNDWWYFPTKCLELVAATPEFTITEPLQDYERF
jgi:hypothetical protein